MACQCWLVIKTSQWQGDTNNAKKGVGMIMKFKFDIIIMAHIYPAWP